MALKLPRTIRLDASDTLVFDCAAEPGEWAVSGAFRFWHLDPDALAGKDRAAFRGGFLGVASFGWSTLAVVAEATERERDAAIDALARHLHDCLGAPDHAAARAAAAEEVAFAATLCNHRPQTLIAVSRSWEGGDIRERFRTLRPRDGGAPNRHDRAFTIVPVEETAAPETVDLVEILRQGRP
jgi:hypothetical protein